MKFLLLSVLCTIAACADTKSLAIERDRQATQVVQDYDDAGHYLADKSGIIAICRAALDIEQDRELGYREQHCTRVLEQSSQIKLAASLWMSAGKSEQNRWFEKNPYEFRELLNALKDYDRIIQHITETDR